MKISDTNYGTDGATQEAFENLAMRGWSNYEIASILQVTTNLIIDARKGYVDFVGVGCAKIETVNKVLDTFAEQGLDHTFAKRLLLEYLPISVMGSALTSTVITLGESTGAAAHLSNEFAKVVESGWKPV